MTLSVTVANVSVWFLWLIFTGDTKKFIIIIAGGGGGHKFFIDTLRTSISNGN